MSDTLVIIGASARAAAFSARRAGFSPWTADMFADADLAALCPARRVTAYPADLEPAAQEAPPGPWMYTGALENHPELVDRIAAKRALWGNAGSVIRRVRDPWQVREMLIAAGLPCPVLGNDRRRLPPGEWLRKPYRSAGGAHIEPVTALDTSDHSTSCGTHPPRNWRSANARPSGHFFQQRIAGAPASGVFVAAAGQARLLGVTRQLIGQAWCGASRFQYAGSIGPFAFSEEQHLAWRRIGDCLAGAFGLTGLFGVDAICNDEGVFPVEVNPRYTASIEVLERAANFSAVTLHARACRDDRLIREPASKPRAVCGKAVVYAQRTGSASDAFWRFVRECREPSESPIAADLPHEGEILQAGRPVITLFAEGDDETAALERLQILTRRVYALLNP